MKNKLMKVACEFEEKKPKAKKLAKKLFKELLDGNTASVVEKLKVITDKDFAEKVSNKLLKKVDKKLNDRSEDEKNAIKSALKNMVQASIPEEEPPVQLVHLT